MVNFSHLCTDIKFGENVYCADHYFLERALNITSLCSFVEMHTTSFYLGMQRTLHYIPFSNFTKNTYFLFILCLNICFRYLGGGGWKFSNFFYIENIFFQLFFPLGNKQITKNLKPFQTFVTHNYIPIHEDSIFSTVKFSNHCPKSPFIHLLNFLTCSETAFFV